MTSSSAVTERQNYTYDGAGRVTDYITYTSPGSIDVRFKLPRLRPEHSRSLAPRARFHVPA